MSPHRIDALTASVVPWAYLAGGVTVAATLVILINTFTASPSTDKNGASLPPGPPATWFWKNPMPKRDIANQLTMLVERYGPVISLRSGRNVIIIIGRMDAATEIMEKEGGALMDRPRMVAISDILLGGLNLLAESAGERFRRMRRAVHTHLQPKAAQTYEIIQEEIARDVILDILGDPKHHMQHVGRYAASVILRITYGKISPTAYEDPDVVRVHKVLTNFYVAFRSGPYLVDFFPWLKHVPGYARKLRQFHQEEISLFREQLNRVKAELDMDKAGPSFAKTLLEHTDDHRLSNDEMAALAGSLFGAGSDTTACGISLLIMAAACYPEAQARVQTELDEVVGKGRVPTFGDSEMLPQLQAFLLEVMRWRPITPIV